MISRATPAAAREPATALTPERFDPEGVIGQLPREGSIVHESHAFEPLQDVVHLGDLETRLQQPPLQLPPAPSANREQPEGTLVAALRVLRLP